MHLPDLARLARAVSFPGKDRLLRLLYSPDKRSRDYITEIIEYDDGLIRVNTSIFLEWFLYFNRYYEPYIYRAIRSMVKDDSVCLDVGANIGCHTLAMANKARHGHVYAFEPNPSMFERLIFNIHLNNLKNVTAFNMAISDKTGPTSLFIPDELDCNKGKCSMVPSTERGNKNEILIKASQIKDIYELNQLDRCDFIKIDVEGFESVCIRELLDLINEFSPVIIFEYDAQTWSLAGASLAEVQGLLVRYIMVDMAHGQPISIKEPQDGDVLCLLR